MAHPLSEFCFSSNKPGLPVNSFEENLIDIYQEVKKPTEEETTTEETEKTEAESTTNDEKTEETTNGDATHDEKDGTEKEKVQDEETLKRKEAPSEPVSESKKRFHLDYVNSVRINIFLCGSDSGRAEIRGRFIHWFDYVK